MKVEKRDNSVLISHDGLSLFVNAYDPGVVIRVTRRDSEDRWSEIGKMQVSYQDFDLFVKLLGEL